MFHIGMWMLPVTGISVALNGAGRGILLDVHSDPPTRAEAW